VIHENPWRLANISVTIGLASRASILTVRRLFACALFAAVLGAAPLLFAQHGGGMSGGAPVGMGHVGAAPVGMGHLGAVPVGPVSHVATHAPHPGNPGNPNGRPFTGIVSGFHHHHGFRNGGFNNNGAFLGSPFWDGPFWDDDQQVVYEQPPAEVQQQPVPVQQGVVEPPRPPGQPLMIEWQGDRYVRVGGNAEAQNQIVRDYSAPPRTRTGAKSASQSLAPAVLAFRDGTRHEVTNYTIVGKTLYESGDYWTQGYWTKKIQLADLDLPETIRLNQERGVPFKLPTAPNDIVTRP
jgi:hypothetical protein